ncbi:hypothetical protein R1sor_006315 [Riccia sorocarpa]|uniref:F-box domain-containing protein n=1 Tax=Riccia sorocarpa TaxID=122646 RepID=A0ABD3HQC6_9MARC
MHASSAKAMKKAKEDLIPSVWRHFPPELLEKVLTKLSVSALRPLCRVCKQWKELIESEAFALKCDSVESTLVIIQCAAYKRYIALSSLATDSWEKHDIEFVFAFGREHASFLGADQGLLLYQVYGWDCWETPDIILVVQNCLSFKWRRLVVPFKTDIMDVRFFETSLLGGLQVDPGTGNFKVVVAFIDYQLPSDEGNTSIIPPREAFIYDSSSNSWTVSVTEAPVEQLFMVNLHEPEANLFCPEEKMLLPPEFLHLAPDMELFDVGSAQRLLERVGDRPFDSDFKPVKALAEGGNWFLLSDAGRGSVDVLVVSNRGPAILLPRLQCDVRDPWCWELLNFYTFPASWRLSRILDRQLDSR